MATELERIAARIDKLLEEGAAARITTGDGEDGPFTIRDEEAIHRWVVRCERLFADVLPPGDPTLVRWADLGKPFRWDESVHQMAIGIVRALRDELLEGNIIAPLSSRVRSATEHELVDQARQLAAEGDAWAAAAWLLAGAAIELRLTHVATREKVTLGPKTTMGAKLAALKQAGKIDASMVSQLGRWLDMRNEAAHRTHAFPHTAAQILAELTPLEHYLRTG